MQVTLLGTNGWFDTATGNTPCVLVETKDWTVIFDAGYGFAKIDQYAVSEKPAYLFLSHFHYDHLIGFHTLAKNNFSAGLKIIGMSGVRQALKDYFDGRFTITLDALSYPVSIHEFDEIQADLPFKIEALPLIHSGPVLGFRLQADGATLAYVTDTGYCANAINLARNADLVLLECSLPNGDSSTEWPHLTPRQAGKIAREANAKQMALIHFDGWRYQTFAQREEAAQFARLEFPHAIAGRDGMSFTLDK
ncbi:MAG: ribonuclease Z [Anaerolineaceae bacterium]|nr:ribonuclease Z [Anaerolineaceae bacterium]